LAIASDHDFTIFADRQDRRAVPDGDVLLGHGLQVSTNILVCKAFCSEKLLYKQSLTYVVQAGEARMFLIEEVLQG
jgi:hypothetical protein